MSDLLELLFAPPGDDDLSRLLVELRWVTLRHPAAARAAARALAEEGRRFAQTDEGRAWKQRLAGSELVQRGQLIWDVATFGALESDDDRMLPTQLIDAFARASARKDLETAIARRVEIDEEAP